jgi:hypothetical protein
LEKQQRRRYFNNAPNPAQGAEDFDDDVWRKVGQPF